MYLTDAELTALKNATNSLGQPSGVSTISNVGIFKNNDICSSALINPTTRFTPTTFARKGTGTNGITYGYALQTSITTFSTFYFAKSTGVLPLQLISFTGVLNNANTQLQWILENEGDAKNFIVERSLNGNNFMPIGTVVAKNIQPRSTYNYEDQMANNLSCATVYYRLRMVDADEKYTYSNIIAINLIGVSMSIAIHPNPVIKVATIKINAVATENSIYQLINNTGRVISHKSILLVKGPNTFTINLSNMAPGIYYLKVTGDIISQKIKFEKL